ncbi:aminodeoxychorismate/anthranilate synthase component II [Caloramator sp. E03]|uniref:anthranilate synthase component II n=1 Tax=Caloramator sp. E03 TaxID=2576307 RepID=UPI0011103EB0|nr:aminodeoxychorismate/anthranilate synthase component II [Caloramator sp. E03]QCX32822.1 aminodeoxychorismate/anthranilate synthase component II [Caloramator sp. E03]
MLLIVDNYDSFTYNIYQYVGEFYDDILVLRNDEVDLKYISSMNLKGIILSPGPGRPEKAGICIDLIREYGGKIPILGICLGHQAIGCAYGGKVIRAHIIKHGKTSVILHDDDKIFKGIKNKIKVMRYHSLIVEENTLPNELKIIAKSIDDGAIMAVRHRYFDVYGLQFHPESILTEHGKDIIKNFLEGICYVSRNN